MVLLSIKPYFIRHGFESTNTGNIEKHKNVDQEIKELISALTNRLTNLHQHQKPGSHDHTIEDENGIRIITLAGSNVGATMRGSPEEKHPGHQEQEELETYINSNFQAINNSIMLGGSYRTNDPGVHLDISDLVEANHAALKHKRGARIDHHQGHESEKRGEEERNTTVDDE